jgi:hypothetical protein
LIPDEIIEFQLTYPIINTKNVNTLCGQYAEFQHVVHVATTGLSRVTQRSREKKKKEGRNKTNLYRNQSSPSLQVTAPLPFPITL